jgi:hypothetical protein
LASNNNTVNALVFKYHYVIHLPENITTSMEKSSLKLQKITLQVVQLIFKNNVVLFDIADEILEYCCNDEKFAI